MDLAALLFTACNIPDFGSKSQCQPRNLEQPHHSVVRSFDKAAGPVFAWPPPVFERMSEDREISPFAVGVRVTRQHGGSLRLLPSPSTLFRRYAAVVVGLSSIAALEGPSCARMCRCSSSRRCSDCPLQDSINASNLVKKSARACVHPLARAQGGKGFRIFETVRSAHCS